MKFIDFLVIMCHIRRYMGGNMCNWDIKSYFVTLLMKLMLPPILHRCPLMISLVIFITKQVDDSLEWSWMFALHDVDV